MSSSFRRGVVGGGRATQNQTGTKTATDDATVGKTTQSVQVGLTAAYQQAQPRLSAYSALPQGCKAWAGSQIITSVGHTEWNALLGGGHPLGTLIWIEEDRFSDLALTLARYWVAEGVAQGQHILFVATEVEEDLSNPSTSPQSSSYTSIAGAGASVRDVEDFVDRLPRNSHLDKFRKKQREHERDSNADLNSPSHEEEDKKVHEMSTLSNQLSEHAIIEEGEEEDEDDEQYEEDPAISETKHDADGSEAGLKIAWQYSKSIQDERAGMKSSGSQSSTSTTAPPVEKNVFCHSFDLSGRLVNQYDGADGSLDLSLGEESQPHSDVPIPNQPFHLVNCCGDEFAKTKMDNARLRGFAMFRRILVKLRTLLEKRYTSSNTSSPVVRLVFLNPPLAECAVYLPLLMSTIRQEQLSVVVMITIQPWLYYGDSSSSSTDYYPSCVRTKRACADAAFSVQGFAGLLEPPATEFRSLAGLLLVERLNNMALSTFSSRRPPANKYGLKRDRRKLHMNLLHLPPEDYSAGGSSVSGGGVRSGGGKDNTANSKSTSSAPLAKGTACGSGMKGGASLLDF